MSVNWTHSTRTSEEIIKGLQDNDIILKDGDKQLIIDKVYESQQLNMSIVSGGAKELAQGVQKYTDKLLLSEKDTTDFLIKIGIIDENGDLTERYK